MLGAIIGDIVGSRFEFDRSPKVKEFDLFHKDCEFTDDTVMTCAVADAAMSLSMAVDRGTDISDGDLSEKAFKKWLVDNMRCWGHLYPGAGYGVRFSAWLDAETPHPYWSCGNGSAMRVSSVGWLFDDLETTRKVARWTAEVTHNHEEGIKGAECVAAIIDLARSQWDKPMIREYVIREFGYDLSRTCDEIRPSYRHVETCQETVPEAITAFFEGKDFEDVIRTAVSLGGDADTLTAIAGSMAEAYYGIPAEIIDRAMEYLDERVADTVFRFSKLRRIAWNYGEEE